LGYVERFLFANGAPYCPDISRRREVAFDNPMQAFDFTHAIVRTPGASVVDGLRDDPSQTPAYAKVVEEHAAYVAALAAAGVAVDVLEPLEQFPDSVFVEDPALVFGNGAILLRPGAPSREGEREPMRAALARHFSTILELDSGEFADGGDVLVTPDTVFIGLSKRTTAVGAEALAAHLATLGRPALVVETPRGVLHFKTAVSLLDTDTLLATPAMAASGALPGFDILVTPPGEEAAANALRVNDRVFVGAHFPRTIELLTWRGFIVVPLGVAEIAKLDAGLSCMSLRWQALP
jgi:dimethylargininase